ncbi:hypothetical protein RM533_03430 [Croceicoccus sp. F390]|uniref:Uncharacterized protein n=1 Tax=Croceicoccus esteveae TaxID=3075597 RepID=A0ABU2ZI23_9SPHN|nr:hypothetical protein [Croceicoccus sp. F390]MDT0575234.1 hypothetical protein [Croceicoccus sp. F390]
MTIGWIASAALLGGALAMSPAGSVVQRIIPGQPAEGELLPDDRLRQVRRQLIIRIMPFGAAKPEREQRTRIVALRPVAEPARSCLPVRDIAGVQVDSARGLLFFTRAKRIYSAAFEQACPVQGFYSGFYMERSSDGMLCAGRDRLHARSGGDCLVGSFAEMIPAR